MGLPAIFGLTLGIALFTSQYARATTYEINESVPGIGVNGFIQTDGTTGALSQSNITGWNLTISLGPFSSDLTNQNSLAIVQGSDFTASATGLFFNFASSASPSFLDFLEPAISGQPFQQAGLCFRNSASNCGLGDPSSIVVFFTFSASPFFGSIDQQGDAQIGTVAVPGPIAGAGLPGLLLASGEPSRTVAQEAESSSRLKLEIGTTQRLGGPYCE